MLTMRRDAPGIPGTHDSTDSDVRAVDEFADIMCADPDWVSAEFDAIVEASFGEPADPERADVPAPASRPSGVTRKWQSSQTALAPDGRIRSRPMARMRAPPAGR